MAERPTPRTGHRRNRTCLVISFVLALVIFGGVNLREILLLPQYQSVELQQEEIPHRKQPDSCKKGRWRHYYFDFNNSSSGGGDSNSLLNSTSIRDMYLPLEVDWFSGRNLPESLWNSCYWKTYDVGLMYTSDLGHQCGRCATQGFRPSHSVWVDAGQNVPPKQNNSRSSDSEPQQHPANRPPSLRLIERLARANQTLCFAGDSIDLQLYSSLAVNLKRAQMLQRNTQSESVDNLNHPRQINITLESRRIPVTYTNQTGIPHAAWSIMSEILETTVLLNFRNGDNHQTVLRYFLTYGWSPWNTAFMEQCNILIMNLALHYGARGQMEGFRAFLDPLTTDMPAAITYLADFASSKENRIAIWRSALPQHFDTHDGHWFEGGAGPLTINKTCVAIPSNSSHGSSVIQNYNKFYDEEFAKLCDHDQNQKKNSPKNVCNDHREHTCTVNRTSMSYKTVYKYLIQNNYTQGIEQRFPKGLEDTVTGKILRWDIADLFDVPWWHVADNDCSHFCYIPPLYEAAFERLDHLLPEIFTD